MVHRDGASFPSVYPYVDFDDKRFVFNPRSHIYEYAPNASENTDVEIWHGVINPSVGRIWDGANDPAKISQFLDKTHDFYAKSGKFLRSTSYAPRVFYYDGYNESRAINAKSVYQYSLSIANAENLAYSRFTKYLLTDINKAIALYDSKNSDTELDAFAQQAGIGSRGSDTMDQSSIDQIPDIQTARPIAGLLKKLYETLNKKTISDEQFFVHNAGRYNS